MLTFLIEQYLTFLAYKNILFISSKFFFFLVHNYFNWKLFLTLFIFIYKYKHYAHFYVVWIEYRLMKDHLDVILTVRHSVLLKLIMMVILWVRRPTEFQGKYLKGKCNSIININIASTFHLFFPLKLFKNYFYFLSKINVHLKCFQNQVV